MILSNNICSNCEVKPHRFASEKLLSEPGITQILLQIDEILPQLAQFIDRFSTTVIQSEVSVITDAVGNMSIDVPDHMPQEEAEKISKQIGIIDRLITTTSEKLSDKLQRGTVLEEKLKVNDSQYVSQLTDRMKEYKRLISLYKHS